MVVTDTNAATEAAELATWATKPDTFTAYYAFPAKPVIGGKVILGHPSWAKAFVSTWMGTILGRITSARIYKHNFGGKMTTIRVTGTNGAHYYGRASWNSDVITLRKVKGIDTK